MYDCDGCSDEELVLLMRLGHHDARASLAARYYEKRLYHARRAAPSGYSLLEDYEIASLFFVTYLNSESNFRFSNATYRKYLETSLSHDIYKKISEKFSPKNKAIASPYSLDEPLRGYDHDVTFHDVIGTDEASTDDPRLFYNYAEECFNLGKLPKSIDASTLAVVRLTIEGKKQSEIAKQLGISVKMVKLRMVRYRKLVDKTLNHGGSGGVSERLRIASKLP